ncbi:MAG: NAD(P)H-dependent oxidoreductase [Epsilonproteobacteria bacterium]|nr:NAD(P)H-dependent oxidoreductase [Campylobacterota bacterium]
MENSFLEALHFRHACKLFDKDKKIPPAEFEYLLEAGRLSPSSFGMEPWRLWITTNEERKRELKPLCWNQNQIDSCSHLVILLSDNKAVQDEEYIAKMFQRRGLDLQATKNYIQRYKQFLKTQHIPSWTQKQCYIFATNMMDAAAMKRIDSCPIEGFEKEKVESYLKLPEGLEVALILTFGYRVKPQPPKKRLPLEKIVLHFE